MIVRTYKHSSGASEVFLDQQSAVVELVASDGRTVQLSFGEDGHVAVRGWGNVPILLGNGNRLHLSAEVRFEEPTADEYGNSLRKA